MKKYLAAVIVLFAFIVACGDNESDNALTPDITFDFQFVTDRGAIQLNTPFELNGSTVMFETANFYFHGLQMTGDGSETIFAEETTHVLAGTNLTQTFSNVNTATAGFAATRIIIGVEETQNGQIEADFTQRSVDDPLSIKDPSMHWNWNSGYKFVRFDGEVDTDDDGVVDTPIAYHLGTDALRTELDISHDEFLLNEDDNRLTMTFNLTEFFNGVDFQIQDNWDTHTGNNLPLAQQLTANLSSTFTITQ